MQKFWKSFLFFQFFSSLKEEISKIKGKRKEEFFPKSRVSGPRDVLEKKESREKGKKISDLIQEKEEKSLKAVFSS